MFSSVTKILKISKYAVCAIHNLLFFLIFATMISVQMMKRIALCILTVISALFVNAQSLTLRSITDGSFSANGVWGVTPMADGQNYGQIKEGKRIVLSSFQTGKEVSVLFDADNTTGKIKLKQIDGYIMSPTGKDILLRTQTQPIYRRSLTAVYYIYNVQNRSIEPLSDGGPQECPLWSRDGNMVAFVRDGNIFLVRLRYSNAETQITKDGKFNEIINGKPDWVYEEEFVTNRSFDFNADGTMIAWIRYDESKVPMFSFPMYKGLRPAIEENALYPGSYEYKYPVPGTKNSTVTVHTYELKSRAARQMKLPLDSDGYIPRIAFSDDPEKLLVMTQNRHQDRLEVYCCNPRSTECRMILRDEVKPYVGEAAYTMFKTVPGGFVIQSERSGYAHLYMYDLNGTQKCEVGRGSDIITEFYGYDPAAGAFYYQAVDDCPMRTAIFKCDTKGKVTRLTTEKGQNSAIFSEGFKYYMLTHMSLDTPPVYSLRSGSRTLVTLEDNRALADKIRSMNLAKPEFFKFTTADGVELNGIMVKPVNFDSSRKYPVIMFQYSGPGSQMVIDSWFAGNCSAALLERYMAQEGFISVIVDGRGTGGRGAAFEKQTYLKLGQLESHDQVETAIWLGQQPYVDKDRIGIWGWSFGGFNTLMSMSEGRPVFYAGVAVAPPTSWRYYDTVYTERYMRTPQENESGYDVSPITRASQLHGSLLICHGLADDNVHFRNVAEYTETLVQADKDFRQLTYTNRNHSIFGGNTRNHLFRQIINHFKSNM